MSLPTIDINGGFADLPNIDSRHVTSPIDFGNLFALDIYVPRGYYNLSDFVPSCQDPYGCADGSLYGFPFWLIFPASRDSGGGIFFFDAQDANDFEIEGNLYHSTITFDSDNPDLYPCNQAGACVATGYWFAPEPASAALLLTGVFGAALALRQRRLHSPLRRPDPLG